MRLPFIVDFSKTAQEIRAIGHPAVSLPTLESLVQLVEKEGVDLKYSYLDEIWIRSEKALESNPPVEKAEILDRLMRSARWAVQRINSTGY